MTRRLIELKDADLALRNKLIKSGQLGPDYNEEMRAIHESNAQELKEIIAEIGYPTIDKVGEEGSRAAWLIIQHSISLPKFMKQCVQYLKEANQADPKELAYLMDRILIFSDKKQLYGTQFDWDENGELSPQAFDDLLKVNERRVKVGFNTLEEQTRIMRERAKVENQKPPVDYKERQAKYNEWRKDVGWIS